MTMIEQAIASLGEAAAMSMKNNPDTYEKDGLVYCSKCNTPLQAWVRGPVDFITGERKMVLMPVRCDCMKEQARIAEEKARLSDFEREMRDFRKVIGMQDCKSTFDIDSGEQPKITTLCRRYVRKWENVRNDNLGILFFGSKGMGKTFFAECIVNALAEKGVMTGATSTTELIKRMQGDNDIDELENAIRAFSLLLIDDLGTERETSFGTESLYYLIDVRWKTGKPTIITTNLDLTDMKNETDISRGRIYDRVIQMCPIAVEMKGNSLRVQDSEERKKKARDFMRSDD